MIKTVLIVDDDPLMRFLVRGILPPEFIGALEADGVSKAKQICDTLLVDLVICDYHLLDGNGGEIYHHLVRQKRTIQFILFTGREDLASLPVFEHVGFQVISKKHIHQLRSVVQSFLKEPIQRC